MISKLAYLDERTPVTPRNGNCGLVNFTRLLSGPMAEGNSSGMRLEEDEITLPRTLCLISKRIPGLSPKALHTSSSTFSLLQSHSLTHTHTHTQHLCQITPFLASSHTHPPQKEQNKKKKPGVLRSRSYSLLHLIHVNLNLKLQSSKCVFITDKALIASPLKGGQGKVYTFLPAYTVLGPYFLVLD